jgi:hypothetical protein
MHWHECNTHNFYLIQKIKQGFSNTIFPVKKNKCGKIFKIMIKSLFNYSLYSHPEIGNFRVWHLANHGAASCPHPSSSKPRHGAVPATRSVSSIGSTHRPLPSSPRPTALRGGPPLPRVVDRRPPPPLRGVVGQPAFVTSFSTERRSQAASAPALGGGPAPFLFNPDVALSFSSTRRIRQLHLTSTRPRDSCFGAAWAPRTPFNRRMVRRNISSPPPQQRDSVGGIRNRAFAHPKNRERPCEGYRQQNSRSSGSHFHSPGVAFWQAPFVDTEAINTNPT